MTNPVHIERAPVKDSLYDSQAISAYINRDDKLTPFFSAEPSPAGVLELTSRRKFSEQKRNLLVEVLLEQYRDSGIQLSEESPVYRNLLSLKNKDSFTVTAGQQIHIYLGPALVLNKILSVLSLAEACNQKGDYHIIPVFWMATEDHDFQEINHIRLFGHSFEWNDPDGLHGPVGRKKNTGLKEIGEAIKALYKNDPDTSARIEIMMDAYESSNNFADASRRIIHQLFEAQGLVVIDPDSVKLKASFAEILRDEITRPSSSLIQNYDELLKSLHIKPQIHPRETNLFVIHEGNRERLIKDGNRFEIHPSGEVLSESTITKLLEEHPENFSPNVALRPVYQEFILPNLAYVAGGSEIIYWFQIRDIFSRHQIEYPLVWLRSSAIYLPENAKKTAEQTGISLNDMFKSWEEILRMLALNKDQQTFTPVAISENIQLDISRLEDSFRTSPWFEKSLLNEIHNLRKLQNQLQKQLNEKFDQYVMNGPATRKLNKVKQQFFSDKQERSEASIQFISPAIALLNGKDLINFSEFTHISMVVW